MNGDEAARTQLREMLLDDVPLPDEAVREAMFARTFAAEPGAGADLLPPDDLFDSDGFDPDVAADPGPSDAGGAVAFEDDSAFENEPGIGDDGAPPADDWSDLVADPGAAATADHDAPADAGIEPGDPSSGW